MEVRIKNECTSHTHNYVILCSQSPVLFCFIIIIKAIASDQDMSKNKMGHSCNIDAKEHINSLACWEEKEGLSQMAL